LFVEVPVGTRYVFKLYETLRQNLWGRFMTFVSEQIHWINTQKADPKSPEVLTPFIRLGCRGVHIYLM
jgi:hypothetical protein